MSTSFTHGRRRRNIAASVMLTFVAAGFMTGCAGPAETALVSAPAVAPAAPRPAAPADFSVAAEGDRLVATWAAPAADGVPIVQYELYINSAPAIVLESSLTTYELPGVTADAGAFVQIRAIGDAGPGMTAAATVERRWPTGATKAPPVAAPSPAPPPPTAVETQVPSPAPMAAADAPAPMVTPAPAPVVAPAPAPVTEPVPVATAATGVTIQGVLATSWVWSSRDVDGAFCQTQNLSLIAYDGAGAIDTFATIDETQPTEIENEEGVISWLCEHKYTMTVTGNSPGYKIVAENQSLDKVKPWERSYSLAQLSSADVNLRPFLSYCSGC